jgi:hypothetical protein
LIDVINIAVVLTKFRFFRNAFSFCFNIYWFPVIIKRFLTVSNLIFTHLPFIAFMAYNYIVPWWRQWLSQKLSVRFHIELFIYLCFFIALPAFKQFCNWLMLTHFRII